VCFGYSSECSDELLVQRSKATTAHDSVGILVIYHFGKHSIIISEINGYKFYIMAKLFRK
jgi:hypothetical protein